MTGATVSRATTSPTGADHAAQMTEGKLYAAAFIHFVASGIAGPDDLAGIVTTLSGDLLLGFCQGVQAALGARHG